MSREDAPNRQAIEEFSGKSEMHGITSVDDLEAQYVLAGETSLVHALDHIIAEYEAFIEAFNSVKT